VTLPNEEVKELLAERFVVGWRNIERDAHVGISHGYRCDQSAVGTTNGAGGRNVQFVVLATDLTVLHVLPGFWHADDLLDELRLGLELHELHRSEDHTAAQKLQLFTSLHRSFLRRLPEGALERSRWQGFDEWEESQRGTMAPRDTFSLDEQGQPVRDQAGRARLKPVVQVVHERLLAQPFRPFGEFDMEALVDYGRPFYDNNEGLDKGRQFPRAVAANQQRAKELAKAERARKTGRRR
jgi:hypothetical protein